MEEFDEFEFDDVWVRNDKPVKKTPISERTKEEREVYAELMRKLYSV